MTNASAPPHSGGNASTKFSSSLFEFFLGDNPKNISPLLEVMQKRIIEWQDIWNKIRPHESLNYLTPEAYSHKRQISRLPTKDVITLQTQVVNIYLNLDMICSLRFEK